MMNVRRSDKAVSTGLQMRGKDVESLKTSL